MIEALLVGGRIFSYRRGEYLARYGILVGRRLCVLSNNSHADPAIATLEDAGARVKRIDPAKDTIESFGRLRLRRQSPQFSLPDFLH